LILLSAGSYNPFLASTLALMPAYEPGVSLVRR
jgi:hypothetical protein